MFLLTDFSDMSGIYWFYYLIISPWSVAKVYTLTCTYKAAHEWEYL